MNKKQRILIVDDNVELCTNIRDILEDNSYAVGCANNGKDASTMSQKNTYDLALVDIKLPDISGTEVVREIASTSPSTEYIYITGYATVGSAIEAVKQEHVVSYETKPLDIDRLISIIKQIFKRREVEDILRKYGILFDNITDLAYICDTKGNVLFLNKVFEKMSGHKPKEFIGKSFAPLFDGEDLKKAINIYTRTLKGESPIDEIYFKDTRVLCEYKNFPLRDNKENIIGVIGIARDISERKWLEEVRKSLMIKLNHKNRELEQFASIVTHDLRSPLVNIQGYSKILEQAYEEVGYVLNSSDSITAVKQRLACTLKDDIPEAIRYILKSTSKADSILSSLSRVSRLGRAELNNEQLDMGTLISDVVDIFKREIKEKGVTLEIDELPECGGDEVQINQVFSNLLENALKYLDPKRPGIIKISGRKEERQVIYCVKDNGIGIAPDLQDEIFEIFRRLNPDDKGGEGLGLSIVRRILDRHEGKVWVESEPGKGSEFFVSLPG